MKLSTPAVGIDLGTTFTLVAHLDAAGRPWTIPNAEGDLSTPSAVLFEDDDIVVGKEAIKAAAVTPERVAQFVKREMGQAIYPRAINGEFYPPEVIQSLLLEKVKRDAEAKLGRVDKAVITVPAYFNEPRRKATQDAGRLAGLDVIDIINEPTAAAIAYGVEGGFLDEDGESRRAETVLVYDLGGGTFDVSLMSIDGKRYTVLATDGNVKLGGLDWDRRLADHVAAAFRRQHGVDPRESPTGLQRLLRDAEEAKRALSAREKVTVTFEYAGRAAQVPVARADFESMTADLIERTRFTVANLLRQEKLGWDAVTRLLLVGGSTRMPMVARMLERESGKQVDRSLSADEAVAHGAAIYAGLLLAAEGSGAQPAGSHRDVKVTNVNSHTLGVLGRERETGRQRSKVMIPRNTPLPSKHSARFVTLDDGQVDVVVKIIEGGDASGNNATPIGRCVIEGLPPGLPAGTPVEVTFNYSQAGRLTVHASVPGAKREARVQIDRASGLSEGQLDEWGRKVKHRLPPLRIESRVERDEPGPTAAEAQARGEHGVDLAMSGTSDADESPAPRPAAESGPDAKRERERDDNGGD